MPAKKPNKQVILEQHINRVQEALGDEDLGMALKWTLKLGKPVSQPQNVVDEHWTMINAPLYTDAKRIDSTSGTSYTAQLDEITVKIRRLSDSYRIREQAGLVVVVRHSEAANYLKMAGYNARDMNLGTIDFEGQFSVDAKLGESEIRRLQERDSYLERFVSQILEQNPSLVLSPLLARAYPVSATVTNPLLKAEGEKIYEILKRVRPTGEKPLGFIGLARGDDEPIYWGRTGIPYIFAGDRQRMLQEVSKALNINKGPK